MAIANPQLEKYQNLREDIQSPDMDAKLDIMRESNIPQGLSAMPGNRPEPSPPIPVFRPQMAMAPQQMPVAQQPRPQMLPVSREMTEEEFNFGNMLREVAPLALSVVVPSANLSAASSHLNSASLPVDPLSIIIPTSLEFELAP